MDYSPHESSTRDAVTSDIPASSRFNPSSSFWEGGPGSAEWHTGGQTPGNDEESAAHPHADSPCPPYWSLFTHKRCQQPASTPVPATRSPQYHLHWEASPPNHFAPLSDPHGFHEPPPAPRVPPPPSARQDLSPEQGASGQAVSPGNISSVASDLLAFLQMYLFPVGCFWRHVYCPMK
jgi:hypothetical protein